MGIFKPPWRIVVSGREENYAEKTGAELGLNFETLGVSMGRYPIRRHEERPESLEVALRHGLSSTGQRKLKILVSSVRFIPCAPISP
jgi:hypothetical protein